jgi:TatD DNase family protein
MDIGCWFSVGPAMLSGAKGRALAAEMPKDRVLTETDGPFAQVDGHPAHPWDVGRAVETLSQLWTTPRHDTQDRLLANLKTLVASTSVSETVPHAAT